jgi:glyoxylase-like metal-dependent hydrolase (beta-lactamase superfamily II)
MKRAIVLAAGVAALTAALQAQQPQLTVAEQQVMSRSMEQPQPSAYPVPMPADVKLQVLPVFGNVFLIAGGKSNVVAHIGDDGVMLVDSATADISDQVIKAVSVLTPRPIRYIVNTTFDADHYGGNERLAAAGKNPTLAEPGLEGPGSDLPDQQGGGNNPQQLRPTGAMIITTENLGNRMSAPTGESSAVPFAFWPSSTFFTPKKVMSFNDEAVEMHAAAAARTDGDLMVFFRKSDVIAAGDVINTLAYPAFNPALGGSIKGILSGLNDIIDLAVPRFNQQGGTRIVPGHGRIMNEADVVEYRDMITIIHDRVKLAIDKKMTLAQLMAQEPTIDYDGLYSTPALTGAAFVEAIYKELQPAPAATTRR